MRDAKNWTDAQAYCTTYKQSLATIFSAFHNTMVNTEARKWVNSSTSWWIGESTWLIPVVAIQCRAMDLNIGLN